MKLEIRKLIFESFESRQELKKLASLLIFEIGNNIYDTYKNDHYFALGFYKKDIFKLVDNDNFPILREMFRDNDFAFQVVPMRRTSQSTISKGAYTREVSSWYSKTDYGKRVIIYYDEGLYSKIEEKFYELLGENKSKEYISGTLYIHLSNMIEVIVHEFQHAYDDYRSDTKIFNTYKNQSFNKNYNSNIESDPEKVNQRHNEYLNLPHEIWARFSQLMADDRLLKTYKIEFKTVNGELEQIIIPLPLNDYLNDFKRFFSGWNILDEKQKVILIRRASANYYKDLEKAQEKFGKKKSINESYDSYKEILNFSESVLRAIVDKIYSNYYEYNKEFNESLNILFSNVQLKKIASSSGSKDLLKLFNKSNFLLKTQIEKESNNRGMYFSPEFQLNSDEKMQFNNFTEKMVLINFKNHEYEDLKNNIEDKKISEDRDENFIKALIYSSIQEIKSTILHEFQHAYDHYRSNGNIFNTPQFSEFKKKKRENFYDTQKNVDDLEHIDYLNLPHEMWARFSQAIEKTPVFDISMVNGVKQYKMKDLNECLSNFSKNFKGWQHMSIKQQRVFNARFTQYYYKQQEEKIN